MPRFCVVILAASLALPARAEIFKCDGKGGADRYQNFPCHLDTIGPAQTGSQASLAAEAARRTPATELRVGMTQDEVTAAWGDPNERLEESLRTGRVETWQYGSNRSVRFDHKRRVVAVQR